jgi:SAM-dependent methyltransferase
VERAEYERMHVVEDRMWWFSGLRVLAEQQLAKALGRAGAAAGPVLDAGCGTGGMLARMGASVAGHATFGLEFDDAAAGLAAAKSGRPVVVGSVGEMPFADNGLAGYLSLDVLCHQAVEPDGALAEARRCLGPGSVAVFNLPAYRWLLSAHDRRVHNVRRFHRNEAGALLARHGFRVLRSTYWNTLLFPLMLLHRLLLNDASDHSDVRNFPRGLDMLFSAVLAFERRIITTGINLPFGGSLLVVAARDG